MDIQLTGLGTPNSDMCITQQQALELMERTLKMTDEERDLYQRLLTDSPIKQRYLGVDRIEEALDTNPELLIDRYLKHGRYIAAKAVHKALADAGKTVNDITGLVVNTCTGYLCPGLSSYLIEDLNLPHSTKIIDIMGMGCGGAIPNLETAAGMLAREQKGCVVSVSVEICSATSYAGFRSCPDCK